MTVNKRSRYQRSIEIRVVDSRGVPTRRPYLDRVPRFRRVAFPDDSSHLLNEDDTWSGLAYRYLGNSYDWWAIAEVNRIVDPWEDLEQMKDEGEDIRIPSVQRMNFDFLDSRFNRLDR